MAVDSSIGDEEDSLSMHNMLPASETLATTCECVCVCVCECVCVCACVCKCWDDRERGEKKYNVLVKWNAFTITCSSVEEMMNRNDPC